MLANREKQVDYKALRESQQCFCGRFKWKGFSFCRRCLATLPEDYRRSLIGPVGADYALAYDSCVAMLHFLADGGGEK